MLLGHETRGCGNVCLRTRVTLCGSALYLPLCLVHWLIGATGDGVDDIDHASGRIVGTFWDLAGL